MENLYDLFICPICYGQLHKNVCVTCHSDFSRADSAAPSFICRKMYQSDTSYQQALRTIDFWGKGWEKRLKEAEHASIYEMNANELHQFANEQIEWSRKNSTLMGVEVPLGDIEGKVALNIGCGAGTEALVLAHSGAQCIAMDITREAADATGAILERIDGGVAVQGDARFIPLKNSSVDFVYSSGVLHHSSDIEKSIAEIFRVLKPGGEAYVMLYAKWSITFLQEKLLRWPGEQAWETGDRKNPRSDVFAVSDCRQLFENFGTVSIQKRGGRMSQFAKIGKFFPNCLDSLVATSLGPNLNIVATKQM